MARYRPRLATSRQIPDDAARGFEPHVKDFRCNSADVALDPLSRRTPSARDDRASESVVQATVWRGLNADASSSALTLKGHVRGLRTVEARTTLESAPAFRLRAGDEHARRTHPRRRRADRGKAAAARRPTADNVSHRDCSVAARYRGPHRGRVAGSRGRRRRRRPSPRPRKDDGRAGRSDRRRVNDGRDRISDEGAGTPRRDGGRVARARRRRNAVRGVAPAPDPERECRLVVVLRLESVSWGVYSTFGLPPRRRVQPRRTGRRGRTPGCSAGRRVDPRSEVREARRKRREGTTRWTARRRCARAGRRGIQATPRTRGRLCVWGKEASPHSSNDASVGASVMSHRGAAVGRRRSTPRPDVGRRPRRLRDERCRIDPRRAGWTGFRASRGGHGARRERTETSGPSCDLNVTVSTPAVDSRNRSKSEADVRVSSSPNDGLSKILGLLYSFDRRRSAGGRDPMLAFLGDPSGAGATDRAATRRY